MNETGKPDGIECSPDWDGIYWAKTKIGTDEILACGSTRAAALESLCDRLHDYRMTYQYHQMEEEDSDG